MRPRARVLLVALTLAISTPLLATPGVAVGAAVSPAQFSQSVASRAERQIFGPELMGKVTKAGKVGNIDAEIGDFVLREAHVPGGRGARTALGPAMVQAATVLHGEWYRTEFSSGEKYYRIVVAIQENQSKQVRAYAKGHLFYFTTGNLAATSHQLAGLAAANLDYDSAGDGCGPYPTGNACQYIKNPANCDMPSSCYDYYALGTYRHKCGHPDWNCDNTWITSTLDWRWWEPAIGAWKRVLNTCSYRWNVLRGREGIGPACEDT